MQSPERANLSRWQWFPPNRTACCFWSAGGWPRLTARAREHTVHERLLNLALAAGLLGAALFLAAVLTGSAQWFVLAALVWLAALLSGVWRYLPMYLQPRVDHPAG